MMEEATMGCAVVCAAGAGALDGVAAVVLAALGFAVAVALAAAVVSVLAGYAWVLALAVAAANVAMGWALVRVWKYGPTLEVFRRHRKARAALPAGARQVAVPARAPLMLEAAKTVITGVVVDNTVKEEPCPVVTTASPRTSPSRSSLSRVPRSGSALRTGLPSRSSTKRS